MAKETIYVATVDCVADGQAYAAGDLLDVRPSTLDSMLRMKQAAPLDEPAKKSTSKTE